MHEIYNPNDYDWLSYYGDQALQTGFGIEGFRGTPYQRGAGLGSFFRALFRMAVPVIKSAGKQVGKHALAAGANVMTDLVEGQPLVESMKRHTRAETSRLFNEAGQALQQGEGLGRREKSINTNDIFSKTKRKNVSSRQKIYSQY